MKELLVALQLARILAGETPGCPVEAKISAAHVYQVNDVWYGDANPQPADIWIAFNWSKTKNPTPGAQYFVSPADVKKMPFLKKMLREWHCKGTTVRAYS